MELSHQIQIRISSWGYFSSPLGWLIHLKLNISVPDTSCSPPHVLPHPTLLFQLLLQLPAVCICTLTIPHLPAVSATSVWDACGHQVICSMCKPGSMRELVLGQPLTQETEVRRECLSLSKFKQMVFQAFFLGGSPVRVSISYL